EDAGLNSVEAPATGEIRLGPVHRVAQIDADDTAAPSDDDIGETAHATADVEYQPPANVVGGPPRLLGEGGLGNRILAAIQLGRSMPSPFMAEIAGILIVLDEARDAVADRIMSLAPA